MERSRIGLYLLIGLLAEVSSAWADEVTSPGGIAPSPAPEVPPEVVDAVGATTGGTEAVRTFDAECVAACQRAVEAARGGPSIGCRTRSRMSADYFCPGSDRMFINPFGLMRAGVGSNACRHALLFEAREEANAALRRNGATRVPASSRDTFGVAAGLPASVCSSTSGVSTEAGRLAGTLASVSAAEVTPVEERDYCQRVAPRGCEALGGQTVQPAGGGAAYCRAGGFAIDSSCLSQSPARLANLKRSIEELRSRGQRCLSGRRGAPGVAPEVGQALQDHLNSETPKTQICCVTGGCNAGIPGLIQARGVTSETAAADSFGNAQGGTIRIPPRTMGNSDLNSTLFHEMLHQLGLCKSDEHNNFIEINFGNWVVPVNAGRCPARYALRNVAVGSPAHQAIQAHIRDAMGPNASRRYPFSAYSERRSAGSPDRLVPADIETFAGIMQRGGQACFRINSCGGVVPPPPPMIQAWDNVFACEAVCYDSGFMAALNEAERRSVRETCRTPGRSGATVSRDAGAAPERCTSLEGL